jgi:tetratricopeptide (TPR) repeat protein
VARDPEAFDAAWKLARVNYWLGGHARQTARRGYLEAGIAAGRKAAGLRSDRPEGYFWLAANMGALAESSGPLTGLKYRKPIREALETVLRLDPAFQDGSADRALGRWYFKVPGLFGGSKKRAEEHLRASLEHDPNSTVSRFFLAEVLLDEDRTTEARAELQRVLDAPINPSWAPEDQEYKDKARALLEETRR